MKVALIDECYQTYGYGGASSWTKRLTSYYSSIHLDYEVFSYVNGLKISLPRFIKLFPNLREMMIYPYLGKRYLPEIEKKFDIIHFSAAPSFAWYRPNGFTVLSVHYILTRQNSIFKRYLPVKYRLLFNPIVEKWIQRLEHRAYPQADRLIVCKQEFKNYLIDKYQVSPEKIRIIKYGIDPAQFTPQWDWSRKERMALFVGRGTVAKGFDTLVEAAGRIKGNIVAVASKIPKFCQKKISQLANFKVVTGIPWDQLIDLYKKAAVFVMPSLSEGSPLTTLEAMASGLPVVCTAEGGGGYIQDGINGLVFPVKNPIALADRINLLFDHSEMAQKFGQLNRDQVETNFALPIIAEQIINVYQELLN